MPSECCVCAVVCGLILVFPSTVLIRVTRYPTGLHLGGQKAHTASSEALAKYSISQFYLDIFIYVHVLMHGLNQQTPQAPTESFMELIPSVLAPLKSAY